MKPQHRVAPDTATRKENERKYFDENWSQNTRKPARKFYSITEGSKAYYASQLLKGVAGTRVLELGCGPGSYAFALGKEGAEVIGIDLSSVAIGQATNLARQHGLSNRVQFQVADAEATGFADSYFDTVCGTGILHHLDIGAAIREITRILKPNGRGIFYEPLGHNGVINLYRALTPSLRSPDERALTKKDIAIIRGSMCTLKLRFFHLFDLGAVPFRTTPLFTPMLTILDGLDRAIFATLPFMRLQAWVVVLELQNPRSS